MNKLLLLVAGIATYIVHPTHFRCPPGWWLPEGLRRNGDFVCRPGLDGPGDNAGQPDGAIYGSIYCTGGNVPIVVDYRTVGCQPRGLR